MEFSTDERPAIAEAATEERPHLEEANKETQVVTVRMPRRVHDQLQLMKARAMRGDPKASINRLCIEAIETMLREDALVDAAPVIDHNGREEPGAAQIPPEGGTTNGG